jgi:phosphate transport system substrate-binding protein
MSGRWRHTDQQGLKYVAVYAAFFCPTVGSAAADPITLRSADGGVAVTAQLLAHDGDVLTLQTEAGRSSLWQEGLHCDGTDCPGDADRPGDAD